MENYTLRLKPGQDLFDSIETFVHENCLIIFSTRPKIHPDFSPHP
jgi:predicted DNA-binding protein with PD1-like motif